MNFYHLNLLPLTLVLILIFAFFQIRGEIRFFNFIQKYWFFERSFISYLSSFFYFLGFFILLISLLDLRGPEEKVETKVTSEKTIILIDTSASMLAEDINPSRLQKAVLMAKHFARKATGHQISVVAFAEIQKKIVPFTNDIELIDARLESLKTLRNHYGSSALTQALQESIQYFKETGQDEEGNILVLTDGEETAAPIDLKIPKSIRIAFVGIGTASGGRIPLDDSRGLRFGYKKNRGTDVITKLNEDFFKVLEKDISTSKYWLVNSYSLPSEDIVNFFRSEKEKEIGTEQMVVRPVYMHWIVVPALICLLISWVLKYFRIFKVLILTIFLINNNSYANGSSQETKELSPDLVTDLSRMSEGKLSTSQKIKLADSLYKAGAKDDALTIFNENMNLSESQNLPPEAFLNYGTALLENGKINDGLKIYEDLLSRTQDEDKKRKLNSIIEKNITTALKKSAEKKKNENQKNDQNKDQKNNNSSSGDQEQKSEDSQGSSGNNKEQNQKNQNEMKNKEEQKKKNDQQDKKESQNETQKNNDDQKKESDQPKSNMPPKKLPAKLKQLMSDDRQIQMKMIENGTRDLNKRQSRESKDW